MAYPPYPTWLSWFTYCHTNFALPQAFVGSDYAMNGGEYWTYAHWPDPVQSIFSGPRPTLGNGGYLYVDGPYGDPNHPYGDGKFCMADTSLSGPWPQGVPGPALANGVGAAMSMTKASEVTDGLSNTFLIGEKNLWPDGYDNGYDGGDDENRARRIRL